MSEYTYVDGYEVNEIYSDTQIIDIIDRKIGKIKNQTSTKAESNSQLLTFQIDRYPDGYDLLDTTIKIHYQYDDENGKTQGGDNSPINVKANDESIIFSWLVPAAATQIAQDIQFMMYAIADGYIFKSLPKSYAINDTLDIGGDIPPPDNTWYTDFVNEMDAKVAAAQTAASTAQEATESIGTSVETAESAAASAESAKTAAETAAASAAGYAGSYVEYTLASSNWDTSKQTYSFEDTYPFESYSIDVEPSGDITLEELVLWNAALIVGSSTSNKIKALGTLPSADIPVMIKVVTK